MVIGDDPKLEIAWDAARGRFVSGSRLVFVIETDFRHFQKHSARTLSTVPSMNSLRLNGSGPCRGDYRARGSSLWTDWWIVSKQSAPASQRTGRLR